MAFFGHGALSGASPEFASNRASLPSSLIDPAPASAAPSFSLPDGSNTRSTRRFSTNTKRRARRARRGARPDRGLSHTGDSVGGPERRPRQRSGFGEEIPPKPLGKSAKPRSGGPDVAVTQIRGLLGGELIFALQGGQPVLGEGWHPDIVGGLEIDPVHAGRVAAEDQLLDRTVGATERSKTIFLPHILGDFEPTQRLDLPLRRPVPNRVGTP